MAIMTLAGKNAIRTNQILQCKKDCSEQGISVTQWCREHGLSEKSYWYYHKKLGDALYDVALYEGAMDNLPSLSEAKFVELTPRSEKTDSNKASIHIGSMTIEVDDTISDSFLERILKVASNV